MKCWLSVVGAALAASPVLAGGFHIDSMETPLALNLFSRQSTLQILYDWKVVSRYPFNPVQCECDAEVALRAMLQDTGLSYDFVNPQTVAVVPESRVRAAAVGDSEWLARVMRGFELVTQSFGTDLNRPPQNLVRSELPGHGT